MEKGRVITGARTDFLLNGKRVGYATNVSGRETVTYEPLNVLGNIQTEEYVPTGYEASLQASTVRIFGETNKTEGFFPGTGKSPDDHLRNILLNGELSAVLIDKKSNKPFTVYEQVKMSDQSFTVNARGMVGQDVSFVCIRATDEGGE